MVLKRIVIENFRSFKGRHELDFSTNSLVFVQGKNAQNGIESATGKSSLLHAISFALGIAPFSQKDLQNWDTEDSMRVALEIDFDGVISTLIRGKGARIATPAGEITGAKDIEAYLVEKTGLSMAQLAFVLYKSQGANSYFLDKTNTEKRDFLSTVLGLERFEDEITLTSSAIGTLNDQILRIQGTEDAFLTQRSSFETDLALLVEPIEPSKPDEAPLSEIKALLAKTEFDFSTAKLKHGEELVLLSKEDRELKQDFASLQPSKTTERLADELKNNIDAWLIPTHERFLVDAQEKARIALEALLTAEDQEKAKQRASRECLVLQEALVKLKDGRCPTCEQPWTTEAKIQEYNKKITALQSQIDRPSDMELCKEFIAKARTQLREKEETLRWQKDNRGAVQVALQASIAEDKATFLAAIEEVNRKTRVATNTLNISQKAHLDAQSCYNKALIIFQAKEKEIELYSTKMIQLIEKRKFLEDKIATVQTEINRSFTERVDIEKQIAYSKDKVDFIKGFLTFIFADVLEEIANETNAYITTIPNVEGISIAFEQEKLTQKGITKNEVVTLIKVNGENRSLQSGCSGGQQAALRLATELATRNVLQRRVGKFWGFMMIDEQFTGLDLISKTACLNILRDFAENHLILAIDHHSEIAAAAVETIQISYSQGCSSFV